MPVMVVPRTPIHCILCVFISADLCASLLKRQTL